MSIFVITAKVLTGNGRYNIKVVTDIETALATARLAKARQCFGVKIEVWENGAYTGLLTFD